MTCFSASRAVPETMQSIVDTQAKGLGGVGVVGGLIGPGADLVAIVPSWMVMTAQLAEAAGYKFDQQSLKKMTMAAAAGIGALGAGTKVASTGIAWLTAPFTGGLSLLLSVGANVGLNVAFTKAYGMACARYFTQTDEIHDLEVVVAVLTLLVGAEMGFEVADETFQTLLDNGIHVT